MSATILKRSSLPSTADPVYETLRSPDRPTRGHRVGWIARKLGLPLMPWQQLVADVGRELIPADDQTVDMFAARGVDARGMMVPAYREVIVTIMRQSGKTTLLLPVECECLWVPEGAPSTTVAYTAQTGLDARQKFTEDQRPILERSAIDQKIRQYYKAADNTGMWWKNGSRLKVLNSGQSAGHGKTLDLAVLDETWADSDDAREQALRPAMVTKPQAQFWNISTAGTQESTFLRRKVELGRAAVASGSREGVAYFEWTIPDDEDVYSPAVWAKYMPAFGITQSERLLRLEADSMKEGEFRRAYGNQWTETEDRIIPADLWAVASKPSHRVSGGVYAIDAKPDRSSAAVAKSDGSTVQLVSVKPGVEWLTGAFEDSAEKLPIVVDGYGPAAEKADKLEAAGFEVVRFDSLSTRKACSRFFDHIVDQKVKVRADDRLDAAARSAVKKSFTDLWAWHREAPGGELLMALSLAYAQASEGSWEPVMGWA